MKYDKSEIDEALWSGNGTLSLRRSFLTSVTSEVVIGLEASMGREPAPKLIGGVSGSIVASWSHLTPAQRRLLVACGGGPVWRRSTTCRSVERSSQPRISAGAWLCR